MNEFLDKLSGALGSMSAAQKKEILADYREHFEAGLADGKSEEEIARALGDPKQIGRMYQADYAVERAKSSTGFQNVLRMLGAVARYQLLGGLTMVCLYLIGVSVLVSLFAAAAGILAVAAAILACCIVVLIRGYQMYALLAGFLTLFFFSFGLLGCRGSAGLWKRTISRFPVLAERLMHKSVRKEGAV
ncbi:MAG: DUF1700 domain-containing protein [Bacillota bacterium]